MCDGFFWHAGTLFRDNNVPWAVRHQPKTVVSISQCGWVEEFGKHCCGNQLGWAKCVIIQSDLAVHKKKVGEVQQWLLSAFSTVSGQVNCVSPMKKEDSHDSCPFVCLGYRQLSIQSYCSQAQLGVARQQPYKLSQTTWAFRWWNGPMPLIQRKQGWWKMLWVGEADSCIHVAHWYPSLVPRRCSSGYVHKQGGKNA